MKRSLRLGGVMVVALILLSVLGVQGYVGAQASNGKRLITVYDRGEQVSFLTHASTVEDALLEEDIYLDDSDTVEPSRNEELIAPEYKVNIYRARPVTVVDGAKRTKIMTPFQTPKQIAKSAGVTVYSEDIAKVSRSTDIVSDGAGLVLTIYRATQFTFDLYGEKVTARTHGDTVGDMLREKGITLGTRDRVSTALYTPMKKGMTVRVWREGKQTLTENQLIGFSTEFIYDADRPLGYRAIGTKGIKGSRAITYEVEIKNGQEISRKEIARITVAEPTRQTLVIGIKGLENGLTRSKGAIYSTDSKGVVHRETYYDLEMRRVMMSCGQGGRYTVRFDGMKIDADGYIIVAANYARYPKCSIVETSAGPGKVYDTGGFVSHHPDGFDLATDWSNRNGR